MEENILTKNLTPKEALEELINGNERYINDLSVHFEENAIRRQHTAIHGQYPIATVLSCSDSRMPVETLLDQGNGDIFVVRVAGNIVGNQVLGSIDYSITVLNVPLVLVLGHTQCGAVDSAVESVYEKNDFPLNIRRHLTPLLLLAYQECSGHAIPDDDKLTDLKRTVTFENVWKEMGEIIRSSAIVRERIKAKTLMIAGAVYDIQSGEVEWLGEHRELEALLQE